MLSYDYMEHDNALVAFVVLANTHITIPEIKEYLRKKLPNYMVPALIISIDRIPYNNNGKINKEKLLHNIPVSDIINAYKRLPETPTQQHIANIWKEVLSAEVVGLDDTFFDLGGHSLLLLRNNEMIKEIFGVDLQLNLFFFQTLEQIAQEVDNQLTELLL